MEALYQVNWNIQIAHKVQGLVYANSLPSWINDLEIRVKLDSSKVAFHLLPTTEYIENTT